MGRKAMKIENRKVKIGIGICKKYFKILDDAKINKSKMVEFLFKEFIENNKQNEK